MSPGSDLSALAERDSMPIDPRPQSSRRNHRSRGRLLAVIGAVVATSTALFAGFVDVTVGGVVSGPVPVFVVNTTSTQ